MRFLSVVAEEMIIQNI